MKYRHQYHAGNFADVHKHVLLLEVLEALTRKDKGLLFVDTHAGRGDYYVASRRPQHPAEWQSGVARLLAAAPKHAALRALSRAGRRRRARRQPRVPGLPAARAAACCAPWIARCSSRHSATRPATCARLLDAGGARARRRAPMDSPALRALLPPPERRGCVLIDPPYEERADFARVHDAVVDALQRFPSRRAAGVAARQAARGFRRLVRGAAARYATARPLLASLLWMHPPDSRAALNGSALVVVNPPYLVEQRLREWLPELQRHSRRDRNRAAAKSSATSERALTICVGQRLRHRRRRASAPRRCPGPREAARRCMPSLRKTPSRRRTCSCGSSMTVIGAVRRLHHQVRHAMPA